MRGKMFHLSCATNLATSASLSSLRNVQFPKIVEKFDWFSDPSAPYSCSCSSYSDTNLNVRLKFKWIQLTGSIWTIVWNVEISLSVEGRLSNQQNHPRTRTTGYNSFPETGHGATRRSLITFILNVIRVDRISISCHELVGFSFLLTTEKGQSIEISRLTAWTGHTRP